jgi:hypothetical protein
MSTSRLSKKKQARLELEAQQQRRKRYWTYGLLALILIFFVLVRVRLLHIPLERDEGEYAYGGQLLLHGIDPFHLCYTMKLPGTAAAYSFFLLLFGQTGAAIHLGLLLVSSATTILIYFLASRFWGSVAGLVAAATFALLAAGSAVLGFAAHATQFVVFFAVSGWLVLLTAIEKRRRHLVFWSGLLFGGAFLMKQPGILFGVFAFLYLLYAGWRAHWQWRALAAESAIFLAAWALPLALTLAGVWASGDGRNFWFWIVSYSGKYGNILTPQQIHFDFDQNTRRVFGQATWIWVSALVGLSALIWNKQVRQNIVFVTGFVVFSCIAICPGFYFRQHYFVLLLPAAALLCGLGVHSCMGLFQQQPSLRSWAALFPALFIFIIAYSVYEQRAYFFEMDPVEICRKIYPGQPFAEAMEIADYIKSHANKDDRLAVLGSEPEIYFYSGMLSATGYIYTYSLTEPQPLAGTMQQQMISEITASHPRFVVLVNIRTSWVNVRNREPNMTFYYWAQKYLSTGYQVRGVIEMQRNGSESHWGDLQNYQPRSENRIIILERTT